MRKIKIFCEGVTDQVFIADCLELFYNIRTERKEEKKTGESNGKRDINLTVTFDKGEIIDIGGCDNLKLKVNFDRLRACSGI